MYATMASVWNAEARVLTAGVINSKSRLARDHIFGILRRYEPAPLLVIGTGEAIFAKNMADIDGSFIRRW